MAILPESLNPWQGSMGLGSALERVELHDICDVTSTDFRALDGKEGMAG